MRKEKKSTKSVNNKVKLFAIICTILMLLLAVRLIVIVVKNGDNYQRHILMQQSYSSTVLPCRRGDIYDANGIKLASSEKVYTLVIDAAVMNTELSNEKKYLQPTLDLLGQTFKQLDMVEITNYVKNNPTSRWYVPKTTKRMSYDEVKSFMEAQNEKNSLIKGVWFEEDYKRIYPGGSLAADVIGFTTIDSQGQYGLEEYYDDILNGVKGREYGYLNDDLNLERTVKSPVDGYNLHSTIDVNLQTIVEKYINRFMEQNRDAYHTGNGAENIGCIIQDVNTGEIRAMASAPTFDLNNTRDGQSLLGSMMVEKYDKENGYYEIKKNGTVITQDVLNSMTEDQLNLNLAYLWKNFCINNTYEPGSVAKPFTVAMALEKGTITPSSTFECHGSLEIGGFTIKCHNRNDGTVTLEKAVAKSCNVAMMKIAQTMGSKIFCDYQQVFNFGLKTNIDLVGEARTNQFVYSADTMGPTDLATNSFGQNFNCTMIQAITGFSSLINGGYYYEPHMVSKITNASGAVVEKIEPRVLKQTISEETSALIRQYCTAVVEYGTGKTARPAGYMIGGKTGTAETIDQNTHKRSKDEYVVSFMGFAPADDPQIAIYVVVDRANAAKQDDAKYATRIVRSILMEALPYLQIYMTEDLSESEIKELQDLQLEITTEHKPEDSETVDTPHTSEVEYEEGNKPVWLSFPVDPNTGYRVDPVTGYKYDAQEGFLVEGNEAVLGVEGPVNPGLSQ
ncbi:MAG: penicillin-binding transpeptidase domain-containing protein [Acetatifactor sp.]